MDHNTTNLPDAEFDAPKLARRRKLLPWWVVGFTWIFIVFAALVPFMLLIGLLHYRCELAFMGLETYTPFSLSGIAIMGLFLFKGFIGVALWTEKPWAVSVAKVDAIISIAICVLIMGYQLFLGNEFVFRLELIAIIPYFYKMNNIQYDWENFDYEESTGAEAAAE